VVVVPGSHRVNGWKAYSEVRVLSTYEISFQTLAPAPPMVQKQAGQFDGTTAPVYISWVRTFSQVCIRQVRPSGQQWRLLLGYWARLSSMSGTDNIIDNGKLIWPGCGPGVVFGCWSVR
jgi:hypothetical protein